MGKFAGKFDSAKQDWETPWGFFAPIDDEFHFTLDAAASLANSKVPANFLTEESDAGLAARLGNEYSLWLNPPYGRKESSQ